MLLIEQTPRLIFNLHLQERSAMTKRTVIESSPDGRGLIISMQATAHEAASTMAKAHCDSIIILDQSESMVGILTERDLMTKVVAKGMDPTKVSVSAIMTKNPRHVLPDTPVPDALFIMKEGGFKHLPIVSWANKVISIFSFGDALPRELNEADQQVEYMENLMESVAY
jgi:signal-transduction protein with cAMP-binding, CBS, and nucleotidyltransferase domain